MSLTIGGIGVAAVTGASFAIASAFNKKNNPGLLDEKLGSSKSKFEIFGPEHFLTKFESKGGFDHFPIPRRRNDKGTKTLKLAEKHQDRYPQYKYY